MKKYVLFSFFAAVFCLFLTSCSSTKVLSSWIDPGMKNYHVSDVLIIGISRDNTTQRLFEDTFVENLAAANVRAEASYKTAGWDIKPNRQAIEAAIAKTGAKSVMITRLVNKETQTNYYPGSVHYVPSPFYNGMYGYYGRVYQVVHRPPMTTTSQIAYLESNLYDVATEKLIWSAQSKVVNPVITKEEFEDFVKVLIEDLRKQQVI